MPTGVYPRTIRSFEERFWKRVVKGEGCWLWTGRTNKKGYGQISINSKDVLAHRASWEIANGSIPEDKDVLHKCDNPPCVRPDHLFLGTDHENMLDMWKKKRHPSNKRESNGRAKLTETQVVEIRVALANGVFQEKLAQTYGVSQTTISGIKLHRLWGEKPQMHRPEPLSPDEVLRRSRESHRKYYRDHKDLCNRRTVEWRRKRRQAS